MDTYCSYSHTVGTAYSESMTDEMSISVGVSYSMSASYFELFRLKIVFYFHHFFLIDFVSESLEVSATTGYDWSQTTETTMNEQTTIELQATAPAG